MRSTSSWRSSAGAACDRLSDALRRHCEAGKPLRILTTTYTNSTEQRALDELSETRRADQGLVRHVVDATPRQGMDVPPRERLLDRVHRLVEPHALGAGARARVERARLGGAQSGRGREDGGGLHELLGEQGLRALRRRGVRAAHAMPLAADGRHVAQPRSSSSCAPSRRRCSSTSSWPATRATIATCSSRRPAPERR